MAAHDGVSVPQIDFPLWCGKLAAALQFVLEDVDPNRLTVAKLTLDEYDAELAKQVARVDRADNVIPIRPFSLDHAINEVLPPLRSDA